MGLFSWAKKSVVVPDAQNELSVFCRTFLMKKAQAAKLPPPPPSPGSLPFAVTFSQPEILTHGDLASSAPLKYAKLFKVAPLALAEEMVVALNAARASKEQGNALAFISEVKAVAPGFVNVTLSPNYFAAILYDVVHRDGVYGTSARCAGETWVVEHTSPNPNKAMHLGHLRNNLVGMAIVRLIEAAGGRVITEAIDNNRGIAIAKMMYGFLAHMRKEDAAPLSGADAEGGVATLEFWHTHQTDWHTPKSRSLLPDLFVNECYVKGEVDFKSSPAVEKRVRDMVVAWEARNPIVWQLWEHVLGYSYEGMRRTLARLGNRWDHISHEHEHYEAGKQFVEEGVKAGVFKRLEDGAVVTDFAEKYKIPDTILLKNDGTSLYITQDIALTAMRRAMYKADKLIWVIGPEQSLAMKQMFAACEQLGIGLLSDFTHVSYGYVGLKDAHGNFQKMSSRAGNVVLIDDVIDIVKEKVGGSEELALAAVKFAILKADRNQDIAFDVEQSIETKGDSGVYVLYTYARAKSLLAKSGKKMADIMRTATNLALTKPKAGAKDVDPALLPQSALPLYRSIAAFPGAIDRALDDLSVHHIAQHLLELCSVFNSWYANETILDGSPAEAPKLVIVAAVAQVIENGLRLLGAPIVEKV